VGGMNEGKNQCYFSKKRKKSSSIIERLLEKQIIQQNFANKNKVNLDGNVREEISWTECLVLP
jgi:hypothetical protein